MCLTDGKQHQLFWRKAMESHGEAGLQVFSVAFLRAHLVSKIFWSFFVAIWCPCSQQISWNLGVFLWQFDAHAVSKYHGSFRFSPRTHVVREMWYAIPVYNHFFCLVSACKCVWLSAFSFWSCLIRPWLAGSRGLSFVVHSCDLVFLVLLVTLLWKLEQVMELLMSLRVSVLVGLSMGDSDRAEGDFWIGTCWPSR